MVYSMYIENNDSIESKSLKLFKDILNIVDKIEDADIIYYTSLNENNNKVKLLHYLYSSKYKNKIFILGPNIEKLPGQFSNTLKNIHNNVYLNLVCDWNINKWNELNYSNIPLIKIPLPIDVNKFKPSSDIVKYSCFIYIKNRDTDDYKYIIELLRQTKYEVIIINHNQNISDENYLETLNKCVFGIWISDEELQNIRLLQALSCNIPLIVNDIKDDKLSSCPYWSWNDDCGLVYSSKEDFNNTIRNFMINISKFKPREYILSNLTPEIIYNYYLNLLNK